MKNATPSPETQAILSVLEEVSWDWANMEPADSYKIAAAVLRAVADVVAPVEIELVDDHLQYEASNPVREKILSIATEIDPA